VDLSRISLRERERGLLIGGTKTGKSWLAEALVVDFHRRYLAKHCRVCILDSKPRFRGEYEASGIKASRRYRKWDHGPAVPGSVVVSDPRDLELAWSTGASIVIAQARDGENVPMLADCAQEFFNSSRASRPTLLLVDETMDFYRSNGSAIGGSNALLRAARAGRERGLAALYCSQRTKGIPPQLLEELTKLYLFRIDYLDDAKRLREMGAPATITPPRKERVFKYWTKDHYETVWGPYTLDLPRR